MNCKKCGAQLRENAKFCAKCGTPVAAAGATPPPVTPSVSPVYKPTTPPSVTPSASPVSKAPTATSVAPPLTVADPATHCRKCGAPLRRNAKFCAKCGTPVATPTGAGSTPPPVKPPVSPTPDERKPEPEDEKPAKLITTLPKEPSGNSTNGRFDEFFSDAGDL